MAAKTIKISDDAGANFYTLPGNQGEISNEAGELDDTIFGQDYKSGQPNLINWNISANALYKGFAGYLVDVKKSGTPTSMTGEATTLVSGKTYKITNAAKNVWSRNHAVTVSDGGGAINASNIESIDYLFGRVTFISGFTPSGSVTIAGYYLPMTLMAKYRSYTLTQTCDAIDETTCPDAQVNGGRRIFDYGLKTVSLELSGVYDVSNGYRTLLEAREELIIEINPDGDSESVARGFFRNISQNQSGNVGALEEETTSFTLSVPEGLTIPPFKWIHTSSSLSPAVVKMITAFESSTKLLARYLPNGEDGVEGEVVVTDLSLSGGIDAMNEFTVSLQGTDDLVPVTDGTV